MKNPIARLLFIFILAAMWLASARAAVTNLAYWRFGENDPGAANAVTNLVATNQLGGFMALQTNAVFTSQVAATAAGSVGSTLALQFPMGRYATNALVTTLADNFGLELWVNPDATNTSQCLAYNGGATSNGWGLYLTNGQYQGVISGAMLPSGLTITPGLWTHLALVRSSGTNLLYVNGVLVAFNTAAPATPVGRFVVAVQPQTLTNDFFSGGLDELRVFGFAAGAFSRTNLLLAPSPSISSMSPANATTSGGTTITLTGTNLGTSGTVNFGGSTASTVAWSQTNVQFTLPAGQGLNVPVSVTVGGQTSSLLYFNYNPPAISNISPTTGPTAGGTPITISGSSFGTSGSVTFGGATMTAKTWSHTQIIGTLPPGEGLSQSVIVTVSSQSSAPALFNYGAPVIQTISPNTGPTAGGTTITLTGTNFGTTGTVNFAGTTVTPTFSSQTNIQFTLPAGQGLNVPVSVTVGGQTSSLLYFNYNPPAISNISPTTGPTAGGIPITISGSSFGTSGSVTFGGATMTTNSWSHTQIIGMLPPGEGLSRSVIVTVSGQSSAPALFNYGAPVIQTISPNTGPTAGGTTITLTGTNFGITGTVTFAGTAVIPTFSSQTNIQFTLPAGQGLNVPVSVTVGGQTSSLLYFNYNPPTISNISPTTGPTAGGIPITISGSSFGTSGSVTFGGATMTTNSWSHTQIIGTLPPGEGLSRSVIVTVSGQSSAPALFNYGAPAIQTISPNTGPTAGGTTITLTGTNFGTTGAVTFAGTTVTPSFSSQTNIQFTLPAGQGLNVPVSVTVGGQTSSLFYFNYNPPAISNLSPTTGPTAGGIPITINGSSFGTSGTVTFGSTTMTTNSWSHTQIIGTLPPGEGLSRSVIVTVSGQSSAPALFNYGAPAIQTISPNSGPTAGGTTITLTGTNFGTTGTVNFAGTTVTPTFSSQTIIQFTLPAGQGLNVPVSVTVGSQTSSLLYFNYNAPSITSISPATGPTAGGIPITINGSSFGTSGTVTFGSATMTAKSWSHTQIIGTLPEGEGQNVLTTVNVSGQIATTSFFSYGAPAIFSVVPTTGPTAGGTAITVTGTNFGLSGFVTVGGILATSTFWSQSLAICLTPPGTGEQPVVVTDLARASNPVGFGYLPPSLALRLGTNAVILSWPVTATDYVLERADKMDANLWATITPALTTNGQNFNAAVPLVSTNQFFRMKRQ